MSHPGQNVSFLQTMDTKANWATCNILFTFDPSSKHITFLERCKSSCASIFDMAVIHGIGRSGQHDDVLYGMLNLILTRNFFSFISLRMLRWNTSDGFEPLLW